MSKSWAIRPPLKVFPLPEAARKRRYKVKEGPGLCDNVEKVLYVPLGANDRDRRIRAHEVAHAVISPLKPDAPRHIAPMAVQRAEDLRCNLYSHRVGMDDTLAATLLDDEKYDALILGPDGEPDRLSVLTAATATVNTGDFEPYLADVARFDPDLADQARDLAERAWAEMDALDDPTWDDTLRLAEAVSRAAAYEPPEERESDEGGGEGEGGGGAGGESGPAGDSESGKSGSGGGDDTEQDGDERERPSGGASDDSDDGEDKSDGDGGGGAADGADAGVKSDAGPSTGGGGKPQAKLLDDEAPEGDREQIALHDMTVRPDETPVEAERADDPEVESSIQAMLDLMKDHSDNVKSGTMQIVEPRRARRLPKGLYGRAKKPSPTGAALRHPARFATDKAIFEETAKKIGAGTVLIDVSGSMRLDNDDLERILKLAPASTIASYCGQGGTGELRILAKDGRRVNEGDLHNPAGYGNVVDLPAVEWLAKQAKPRLWVCDGVVTGVADRASANIAEACASTARRFEIRRLGNIGALEDWLRRTKGGRKRDTVKR